jgi:hypothetical protein
MCQNNYIFVNKSDIIRDHPVLKNKYKMLINLFFEIFIRYQHS